MNQSFVARKVLTKFTQSVTFDKIFYTVVREELQSVLHLLCEMSFIPIDLNLTSEEDFTLFCKVATAYLQLTSPLQKKSKKAKHLTPRPDLLIIDVCTVIGLYKPKTPVTPIGKHYCEESGNPQEPCYGPVGKVLCHYPGCPQDYHFLCTGHLYRPAYGIYIYEYLLT